MSFKIIVFVTTIWIVVSLICGAIEGALLGSGGASQDVLSTLMESDFGSSSFWGALVAMITFDFPTLFQGPYAILQWVFFLPLLLAFGVMFGGFILAHIPLIGRGT